MVAVKVHTVKPWGERGIGWRPSSIAKHPVIRRDHGNKYCEVKFNVLTWG